MVLSFVLVMSGPTWAQEAPGPVAVPAAPSSADEERAKLLYNNGRTLYAEGNYEAAILAFREAYALSNRHELLFNVANAEERLGRLNEALDTLNRFRVYADEAQQEAINRRIYNIERRLREEAVRPVAPVPSSEAVTAPQPGASPPTPQPPSPAMSAARPRPWLWTMGAGLAVAAGGGVTAAVTYDASRPMLRQGGPEAQDRYESLRPVNNGAIVGAMVGGAVAVTGLVVDLATAGRSGVALSPAALPGSTGAVPALVVGLSPGSGG